MNRLPYHVFPIQSDGSILLREVNASDIPALVPISFYNARAASSVEDAMLMHEKIEQDYRRGQSIHWGIINMATDELVGTCGYYRGFENETGELGCVLLEQYRGKGYMVKAMKLAIDFGWDSLELKKIKAITTSQNQKAISLIERLGFQRIGEQAGGEVEFELRKS